jgi:hypothetical protein
MRAYKVVGVDKAERFWSIAAGRTLSWSDHELNENCSSGVAVEYFLDREVERPENCGPLTVVEDWVSISNLAFELGGIVLPVEYEPSKDTELWSPKSFDWRDVRKSYPGTRFADRVRLLPIREQATIPLTSGCQQCGAFHGSDYYNFSCNGYKEHIINCYVCRTIDLMHLTQEGNVL